MLYFVLKKTGWNSVFFLFLILFGLYGYSVPISVYLGLDIGWHRVEKLSSWQQVDYSLISFLISNQLAQLGILITIIVYVKNKYFKRPTHIPEEGLKRSYLQLAVVAGFLSSVCEGINFIRAGGFSTIAKGKAFYQGAVNDLVLNIPYEGFFYISVALFGLYLKSLRPTTYSWFNAVLMYFISIVFILAINVMIGERGTLVVAIAIFFLSYTFDRRITRIKRGLFFFGLFLYVVFNILTLLREKDISYKGATHFVTNYGERLMRLLNPANTEFGASALNYRIYIDKRPEDFEYFLGATYTEVFWAFVPTYVYPGKPLSIIYIFRDTYFPERKSMGSTAGTGFSSLMEAHMNFGYFGPLITYFLSSLFLILFEAKRTKAGLYPTLVYLLLFNIYLIYSRSASQYILATLIFYIVQIFIVWVTYRLVPKNIFSYLRIDEKP